MSAPANEEEAEARAHRARLKRSYTRRLRVLELRAARQGDDTDPATDLEIEDLRAKIADLQLADAPAPDPEVKEAIRRRFESELDFLIVSFRSINERLTRGEERDVEVEKRLGKVEEQHATDRLDREQRQQELDEWRNRQDKELHAQSDVLTTINTRGHKRHRVEWAILIAVIALFVFMAWVFA